MKIETNEKTIVKLIRGKIFNFFITLIIIPTIGVAIYGLIDELLINTEIMQSRPVREIIRAFITLLAAICTEATGIVIFYDSIRCKNVIDEIKTIEEKEDA